MLPMHMSKLLSDKQQEAITLFTESGGGLCWWKVGEGKTRIAIFWFLAMVQKMHWLMPTYCVVVCRRKSFLDWRKEIKLCAPQCDVFENDCPVRPPKGHAFLLISDGVFASLQKDAWFNQIICNACVLDEGWLYANHKTGRSVAAHSFTDTRHSCLLSGTMMKASDVFELYAQAMATNRHLKVARTPTAFRTEFQVCQRMTGFPSWRAKGGAKLKILSRLRDCSHIYFPEGNRKIVNQYHDIESTPEQVRLFKELKDYYSASGGTFELELNNALAVIAKAQQISDGWIKDKNGKIHTVTTNKVQKLHDELDSIASSGQKCIVFCAFRYDVTMLAAALPFATVQMVGGTPFNSAKWNRPDIRICLATEASASAVNHFEQVPYAIYFSGNFKWKDMQQSRGRTDRKSSTHSTCYYKYLQVLGSYDSHVYKTAMDSGSDEQALIKMRSSIIDWLHTK